MYSLIGSSPLISKYCFQISIVLSMEFSRNRAVTAVANNINREYGGGATLDFGGKMPTISGHLIQVFFSENFKSSFQKLKSSEKKLALGLLLKVARGWRPRNTNVDRTCENSLYDVKQFKVGKYYVLCSVDAIKDSMHKQVLRVWDILLVAETSKLLKQLESIFCMYTDDFVNHCKVKLFEGNLEVPNSWPLCDDLIRFKNCSNTSASDRPEDCTSIVEDSRVSESLLLMKFYSLSTGAVNYLLSDLKGREVPLPFEVTEEEREKILFPRSILGGSGTGKTTILSMKLFQKHQLCCIASRDSTEADNNVNIRNKVVVGHYLDESKGITLHQLFVTMSPKLCYAVKSHICQLISFAREHYSGSMNSTGVDDIDDMADFKDIPDTFVSFPQEKYPLIITFQKFLIMLDGTPCDSVFHRFHDARDFCYESTKSVALQTLIRKKEVTYDRFISLYWHNMNAKLTKNLDASRVFTEIMSHIKEGLKHGEACDRKLSREDYISLSRRRASTLSSEKREAIYNIFEDYEKIKLEQGVFDFADRAMDIHHRLKRGHLLGDKMDFVYIDEVQDLTIRQILLFRYVCNNVDEGFVFSGDTAQTIARGINYRFQDIRSLFYNEFLMKSRNCEVSGSGEKDLVSASYCLSQNFRTHTGVLKLAQSVVDLICRYFPNSIDSLPPETSRVYGESPVVLKPGCNENSIISIFGKSAKGGRKCIGFGAGQVTLVRDYFARSGLLLALFLATVECKGLEFQENMLVYSGSPNDQDASSSSSPKPNLGPIPAMLLSSMNSDESIVFFPSSEITYTCTFDINLREYDIVGQSMPTHGSWLVLYRIHTREIFLYNGRRRINLPDLPTQPQTILVRASFAGDPDRGCHVFWMEFYGDYFVTRMFDPAHDAWGEQVVWVDEVDPMGMITTREGYCWIDRDSGDLWSFKNYWEVLNMELIGGLIRVEGGVPTSICSLLDEEDNLAGFVLIIRNGDENEEWEEVIGIFSLVYEQGGMAAAEAHARIVPFGWSPGQNIYCSVFGPGLIKNDITYTQDRQLYLGSYDQDDCVVFNGEGGRVMFWDGDHRYVLRSCYSPDIDDDGTYICDCRVIILSLDESDFPQ